MKQTKVLLYFELTFAAALVITLATIDGCASIMTWLDATVTVAAPIFFACAASRSGEIARSFAATMYHDGFDFQAGVDPETGCLAAALGCELSRLPSPVKDAVTHGGRQIIDFLSGIAPGQTKALRRKQAIVVFSSIVGGMTLARMTSNGELRQEI
jgi:hypothetical protein